MNEQKPTVPPGQVQPVVGPCPFCGEADREMLHVTVQGCERSSKWHTFVRCLSCRANGPHVEGEGQMAAIRAWNERANAALSGGTPSAEAAGSGDRHA
jgi:Lar family restriction alleviation protein